MRYRVFLVLLVWLFGSTVTLFLATSSANIERFAEMFRQRYDRTRSADPRIVLVGLDDAVFAEGHFNRPNHARIIKNLEQARARLVMFDIVFDENREPADDQVLLDALLSGPPVVLAGSSLTLQDGSVLPPRLAQSLTPALTSGNAHLASIEKAEDPDGTLRHYFLGVGFGQEVVPSVALACYALLNSVPPGDIDYGEGSVDVPPVKIPVEAHHNEGTDVTVLTFDLKFHQPATGPDHQPGPGTYRVVPYLDLLDPSPELLESLRDKVVVIGENTSSENDVIETPAGPMKGFEGHAQCIDRLLHHDFYSSASEGANLKTALALVALVAALGFMRWPLPGLIVAGGLMLAGYAAANLWLFQEHHLVVDLAAPVVGGLATIVCLVLVRLALASRFLGRFIPKEAAAGILLARRTAQATEATVIVTDIRGYTSLSETRTPVEMLQLLNEYHSVTVDIYHKHGGNVLTFQGDAQLVVFGYPRRLKDAAGASVEACVEVMAAIDALRAKWGIKERKNFDVGAGICTGLVYVGDIGSREQANYTVIGEVVRTSHKVQSMSDALEGNVLMDEPAYQACRVKPNVTAIPNVTLEGFPEPKTLYRVEARE